MVGGLSTISTHLCNFSHHDEMALILVAADLHLNDVIPHLVVVDHEEDLFDGLVRRHLTASDQV